MLPGKQYKPEDFLWIAWARKWFIIIPTVILGAATFVWSAQLPNRYRAEAVISIVPQRVPITYVRPTVTAGVAERLQFLSQQILSRTRLEQMIQDLNLYPAERATMLPEDVVALMRRDINGPVVARARRGEETTSFSISYQSAQARTAMVVTERLASLFVKENLQGRGLLADATSQFMENQLAEARKVLVEHERKLEAFRERNAGRLPTQAESNLRMMQSAQTQLLAFSESLGKDRDRLSALDAALAAASAQESAVVPVAPAGRNAAAASTGGTAAQQLEAARTALRALELRLKAAHPDVTDAKRRITELEAKAEAEALQQPLSPETGTVAAARGQSPLQTRSTAMQLEAAELRQRLNSGKDEEARLQRLMASYATRVEAAPGLETELSELMRDYTTLKDSYDSLRKKAEDSKLAANLERQEIGEQFNMVDSPRLPEKPYSPDRLRLNLMGLLAGLGLGVAVVALLEYRDTTLKTDDDIVTSLALPVLAVIPVMLTAGERERSRRRRLVLALSASAASALFVAAVLAWRLNLIPDWVR